jgi:hypothetical protein
VGGGGLRGVEGLLQSRAADLLAQLEQLQPARQPQAAAAEADPARGVHHKRLARRRALCAASGRRRHVVDELVSEAPADSKVEWGEGLEGRAEQRVAQVGRERRGVGPRARAVVAFRLGPPAGRGWARGVAGRRVGAPAAGPSGRDERLGGRPDSPVERHAGEGVLQPRDGQPVLEPHPHHRAPRRRQAASAAPFGLVPLTPRKQPRERELRRDGGADEDGRQHTPTLPRLSSPNRTERPHSAGWKVRPARRTLRLPAERRRRVFLVLC